MAVSIESLIQLQRQTVGARSLGLSRLVDRLGERADCADLVPHAKAAFELHRKAARLAFDWRRAQKNDAAHLPGAQLADRRLDRAVTALADWLDLLATTGEPEEQSAAIVLIDKLFPNGPGEIVNATFQEEHALVTSLLEVIDDDELADAREAVEIESLLARIERLNFAYGELLVRPERLEYTQVRAADQASYEAFAAVVARLMGKFPTNEPEDLEARTSLLEPLLDQQDHLSDQRARARGAEDDDEDDGTSAGETQEALPPGDEDEEPEPS